MRRVGIDASNLRVGGGVTHLVELLRAAVPKVYGFDQVIVWGGAATLNRIEDRDWLRKEHDPLLDRALHFRVYWQRFKLAKLARAAGCDVLFVPGGSDASGFKPMVAMSRNMLPFEWRELVRYGWSWMALKMLLLRWRQSRTFRRANGLVFLTEYAKNGVMRVLKNVEGAIATIPHGIGDLFFHKPRTQRALEGYSRDQPFRILYVSIVEVYKHQWCVAEAVATLRESGLPVRLDLVGPAYPPALRRLTKTLHQIDPARLFVKYLGSVAHSELNTQYAQADLCIFASSCENMPNILLEGMASGLPIACSNRGPMPEVLGDSGVYFDPEHPDEIAKAIRTLIDSPKLRQEKARTAFERAQQFSWSRCADTTFEFLASLCEVKG